MTGDLCLLVKFDLKVDGSRFAQRLQVKRLFLTRWLFTRHGLVRLQVVLDILGSLDRPRRFGSEWEGRFGFGGVETGVAFTDKQADSRDVDVGSLGPTCVILVLEPGVEDCRLVTRSVIGVIHPSKACQLT